MYTLESEDDFDVLLSLYEQDVSQEIAYDELVAEKPGRYRANVAGRRHKTDYRNHNGNGIAHYQDPTRPDRRDLLLRKAHADEAAEFIH
jgi:hypothetical protein